MARRQKTARPKGLDWVWAVMRERRVFTWQDLIDHTNVDGSSITTYLTSLVRGGYLEKEGVGGLHNPATYTLIRDVGVDRPRLRKDGSKVPEQTNQKVWRLIKTFGDFSWEDLSHYPGIKPAAAQDYIQNLARAGILVTVQEATHASKARYTLPSSHNTGPKAPQVKRNKTIFDPNTGKAHHKTGGSK
ncbi:MAG: hypothetical protein HQL52_03815 [Magnetococcales bacterium]|nr:hypothetical protein [Magnetococcales bacterium]